MNFILHCSSRFQNIASVRSKYFIFDVGHPDSTKKGPDQQQEVTPATPADVDKSRNQREVNKQALEREIAKNLDNKNSSIHEAVQKAQDELQKLNEKNDVDPALIEATLNTLRSTVKFYEQRSEVDDLKKQVTEKAQQRLGDWTKIVQDLGTQIGKDHPELSDKAAQRIHELLVQMHDRGSGAIEVHGLLGAPDKSPSYDEFLKDPTILEKQKMVSEKSLKELNGELTGAGDLNNELQKIDEEYDLKIDAVICSDMAKDDDGCVKYIDLKFDQAKAQLEGLVNPDGQKKDVSSEVHALKSISLQSAAQLDLLNKPADRKKRALVMAEMSDSFDAVIAQAKNVEFKPSLTNQTLEENGMKKDIYARNLNTSQYRPADISMNLPEKVNSGTFAIKGNPQLRLALSGMGITVLKPGTEVQIISKDVVDAKTDKGVVTYVQVRVNPPDGPTGLISSNMIDFTKPLKDAAKPGPQKPPTLSS